MVQLSELTQLYVWSSIHIYPWVWFQTCVRPNCMLWGWL